MPLFVSFHTGGQYERHAAGLVETLERFGLPYEVERHHNAGEWVRNCAAKAEFVLHKIQSNPGRPIVWIDADARVRRYPELLMAIDADFAGHWLDERQLCSGTVYFGGTENAERLAAEWAKRCRAAPTQWDQQHLDDAIAATPGLSVIRLPEGYVRIFDRTNPMPPHEIFIEHLQASRKPHD